jgi:hypothetical protein
MGYAASTLRWWSSQIGRDERVRMVPVVQTRQSSADVASSGGGVSAGEVLQAVNTVAQGVQQNFAPAHAGASFAPAGAEHTEHYEAPPREESREKRRTTKRLATSRTSSAAVRRRRTVAAERGASPGWSATPLRGSAATSVDGARASRQIDVGSALF